MARTVITAQKLTLAGVAPSYQTPPGPGPGNGFSFLPAPGRFLWIKNANAAACVVTLPLNATKVTVDGNAPADPTVSVPLTTGERFIGGFHDAHTGSDGYVYADFSVATSVSVALIDP